MSFLKLMAAVTVILGTALLVNGCSSGRSESVAASVPAQADKTAAVSVPAVLKSSVLGIAPMLDQRPVGNSIKPFVWAYNRPEMGGFMTLRYPQALASRLEEAGVFKKVTFSQSFTDADFVLNIRQNVSSVRVETWIPFSYKLHTAFDYDLELVNAKKQVVWKYKMTDSAVNYPSSFRVRGLFNVEVFQERMLDRVFPEFLNGLCDLAARKPELFNK